MGRGEGIKKKRWANDINGQVIVPQWVFIWHYNFSDYICCKIQKSKLQRQQIYLEGMSQGCLTLASLRQIREEKHCILKMKEVMVVGENVIAIYGSCRGILGTLRQLRFPSPKLKRKHLHGGILLAAVETSAGIPPLLLMLQQCKGPMGFSLSCSPGMWWMGGNTSALKLAYLFPLLLGLGGGNGKIQAKSTEGQY